ERAAVHIDAREAAADGAVSQFERAFEQDAGEAEVGQVDAADHDVEAAVDGDAGGRAARVDVHAADDVRQQAHVLADVERFGVVAIVDVNGAAVRHGCQRIVDVTERVIAEARRRAQAIRVVAGGRAGPIVINVYGRGGLHRQGHVVGIDAADVADLINHA